MIIVFPTPAAEVTTITRFIEIGKQKNRIAIREVLKNNYLVYSGGRYYAVFDLTLFQHCPKEKALNHLGYSTVLVRLLSTCSLRQYTLSAFVLPTLKTLRNFTLSYYPVKKTYYCLPKLCILNSKRFDFIFPLCPIA